MSSCECHDICFILLALSPRQTCSFVPLPKICEHLCPKQTQQLHEPKPYHFSRTSYLRLVVCLCQLCLFLTELAKFLFHIAVRGNNSLSRVENVHGTTYVAAEQMFCLTVVMKALGDGLLSRQKLRTFLPYSGYFSR